MASVVVEEAPPSGAPADGMQRDRCSGYLYPYRAGSRPVLAERRRPVSLLPPSRDLAGGRVSSSLRLAFAHPSARTHPPLSLTSSCRPAVAAGCALLPAVVGTWWCRTMASGGSEAADEDRALALLWSTAGVGFLCIFCAAMIGVRDKVCERDLEHAMTDTTALFVSCAPAAHAAVLWLSQGPTVAAPAVAAGVAGAALGAIARWLLFPERLRAIAIVAGFIGACASAASWAHGHLVLVAWCSACVARAYEFGIRYVSCLAWAAVI